MDLFLVACPITQFCNQITSDLLQYNYGDDIDLPNYQVWSVDDESWQKTVYFSNPTTGVDHNTLFNVSGLVALSDTNLTATPGKID